MSAIASFFLIETSKLEVLTHHAEIIVKKTLFSKKVTDNYWDFLSSNARELNTLSGNGYIYGNLLIFLQEEKAIDLMTGIYEEISNELIDKRGNPHFLFTYQHKVDYLSQLALELFTIKELQAFNQSFSDEGDIETAELSLEAIRVLHENIGKIESDQQVLMLIVG